MVGGHKVLLNSHGKLIFVLVSLSSVITFSSVKLFFSAQNCCAPAIICYSSVLS